MSRSTTFISKALRHLARWLVVMTMLGVLVGVISAVVGYYERADDSRLAQTQLAEMYTVSAAVRYQPMLVGPPLVSNLVEDSALLRQQFEQSADDLVALAPSDATRRVKAAADRLNVEALAIVDQLMAGNALTVESTTPVTVAFLAFSAELEATVGQLEQQAKASTQAANQAAVGGIVVVALAQGILMVSFGRLRRREANTAHERAAIKRSEYRFRALVQESSDVTMVIDPSGTITYVTPAVAGVLGREPAELTGQPITELIHPEDPNVGGEHDPSHGARAECRFRHADGTWRVLEVVRSDLREDKDVGGIVLNARDVTDRVELELELRRSQKLESVGQLASGIAHEINTPVQFVGDNLRFLQDSFSGLVGLLSLYQETFGDTGEPADPDRLAALQEAVEEADLDFVREEVPHALEEALGGVDRVATIVRAMKAFGHPDGDEQRPVDLNDAVKTTLTVARNEIKYVAKVISDLGELPQVTCYAGDISQVLLNLLVNASHAIQDSNAGTTDLGTITVRTRLDGDAAVISIQDSGGGVPDEIANRIFDPFFTTKDLGRGTGQGLSMARTVVHDRHGGTLTFESEPGQGTTFFIRLPVAGAGLGDGPGAEAGSENRAVEMAV